MRLPNLDSVSSDAEVLEAAERSRATVHRAWRRGVVRRRLLRSGAAVLLALGIAFVANRWSEGPAPEPVATIVESFGDVTSRSGDLSGIEDVVPGDLLRTGLESGVRLRLADGTDLRLDSESTLEWLEAPSRGSLDRPSVRLSAGALYFRSPPSAGSPLAITTPFGDLVNRGTEYEVRLLDELGLEVAVRQGSVLVRSSDGGEILVEAGERLVVPTDGEARRVDGARAQHDWTLRLSRPFSVDGKTIEDFVRWVAEERGLEVRWLIDEGTRRTRLRGELIWRDPEGALLPTLRMAGLQGRVDGRLLTVGTPRDSVEATANQP